ncbi:hypothetical protein HJC23_005441 [Cyclotella cryptica]|uniref:Uncharacterized protein n=1 Tax=Cyclotella cryptica TaxID=29204 RepID=A0ABD3P3T8_9STRA
MDLIRELDETNRNRNPHPIVFRGLHVPFPELDHEDDNDDNDREHHHRGHQRLNQPSDSETGDSTAHRSSSSSTTTTTATSANMESSTSSTTLSESLQGESVQDDIVRRPLRPAADCPGNETTHDIKLPPSQCPPSPTTTTPPPQRRISFQDEMQSIDISSVSDPVSCIKRILDGLVSELKEQCGGSERRQDKKTKEVVVSAVLERHAAKRTRTAHGCADEEEEEGAGDATPDSSSDANAREQQQQQPQQTTIQTIMNWMDTFQDSEPVQLTCLQSLPSLLEHNTLRYHAQMEGLASIVLYDMAAFQENFLLQLTAFHTLVVLLRPLGAMEGTLVRTGGTTGRGAVHRMDTPNSTVKGGEGAVTKNGVDTVRKTQGNNTTSRRDGVKPVSSILSNTPMMSAPPSLPLWEENGVRVMLDVLRLYSHDRYLQAMGCWAMVNAALYPTLKKSLLKLGGVYVVTNAMMLHPSAEAVQFRGLFALINLVIPGESVFTTLLRLGLDSMRIIRIL